MDVKQPNSAMEATALVLSGLLSCVVGVTFLYQAYKRSRPSPPAKDVPKQASLRTA